MRTQSQDALHDYINNVFVNETDIMRKAYQSGEHLVAGMQLSPSEGKTIYVLAQMIQAKHVLEIGTFSGYSALWLAQAVGEGGSVTTLEAKEEHANIAQELFEQTDYPERFIIKQGKALDTLRDMQDNTPFFDLVFIDAAKSEYAKYLELVSPMIRSGGLIIGDNTLLFGHLINNSEKRVSKSAIVAMQEFNATLGSDDNFSAIMLPTMEGLTVALKL